MTGWVYPPTVPLSPIRTVAPAVRPVSLEEAKDHVGAAEYDDDDRKIESCLNDAVEYIDGYKGLGQALITQTWKVNLCGWPCDGIRLPLGPVQSVATVKYYNSVNSQATLSTTNYALYTDALGPYIGWLHGYSVPTLYPRADAIEVTFVAGYGDEPKDVPAPIRRAILLLVGHWFENRETVNVGQTVTEVPLGVAALLGPYRHLGV
jgi:uncharacterized phiE125 gp8 family phage protein